MNQFLKMMLALAAFVGIAVAAMLLSDDATKPLNDGVIAQTKARVLDEAKKHPEKFASFDMTTLNCRAMDMKGAVAILIPVLCYAKNKEGTETEITDLVKSKTAP